jgi:hypothetical protein
MGLNMKNRIINVQGALVSISTRYQQDYISLTDMVKHFDGGSALIEQWLKNKDTVLFLSVWEKLNNPAFNSNSLEFEGIKAEAGRNSFFLSAKNWIEATQAQRLTQLNAIAITQMRSLVGMGSLKMLGNANLTKKIEE